MAKIAPGGYKKFSKQETKVFTMLLQEYKNAEIGKALSLDEKTISTYKLRLLRKTGAKTIIGLYVFNLKHKIVFLEGTE
jgi:DNA-binding NarL/FixJ family response regulator